MGGESGGVREGSKWTEAALVEKVNLPHLRHRRIGKRKEREERERG